LGQYIFVADESGNPGINSRTSNTYVFGGYVLPEGQIDVLTALWKRAKFALCDTENVELKWKHFFANSSQQHQRANPIKLDNPEACRLVAVWILQAFFSQTSILPAIAVSRKDRASKFLRVSTKRGASKLDDDLIWLGPVAQFAAFLNKNKSTGRLIFDSLNQKQQIKRQLQWSEQLQKIKGGQVAQGVQSNFRKLLLISENIEFQDSRTSDLVQIADFVCGVIWNAGQGDEAHLSVFYEEFGRRAEREGLGLVHI
jgi:hypothetical protein